MAMSSTVTFNFEGKTALVTGGSRGIGRAVAKALSAAGAVTYALSKTQQHLDELVAECPSIRAVCVDLCDWERTRAAVEAIGNIDLLVNNAGISDNKLFVDVEPHTFDEVFNVSVKAVIAVSQIVARSLIARKSPGSIVNVSTMVSARGAPRFSLYCAAKGALDQLTRCMAIELGAHQIRVNTVHPCPTLNERNREMYSNPDNARPIMSRIPLGHFAEVDDMASVILYLLSDSSRMVHGAQVYSDGGFTTH